MGFTERIETLEELIDEENGLGNVFHALYHICKWKYTEGRKSHRHTKGEWSSVISYRIAAFFLHKLIWLDYYPEEPDDEPAHVAPPSP